jgi:hypothetical protein
VISTIGGSLESGLAVLINTLHVDFSDCDGPDVELVVSPVDNAAVSVSHFTCLQLPTPDAHTRSGDFGGHILWGISRILRARAYLDLLVFYRPSLPDSMRVISGTGSTCFDPLCRFTRVQF